jgi:hypothetical protein
MFVKIVVMSSYKTFVRVIADEFCCPGSTHEDYPLLKNDILRLEADGTWFKIAQGIAIGGFVMPNAVDNLVVPIDADTFQIVIL